MLCNANSKWSDFAHRTQVKVRNLTLTCGIRQAMERDGTLEQTNIVLLVDGKKIAPAVFVWEACKKGGAVSLRAVKVLFLSMEMNRYPRVLCTRILGLVTILSLSSSSQLPSFTISSESLELISIFCLPTIFPSELQYPSRTTLTGRNTSEEKVCLTCLILSLWIEFKDLHLDFIREHQQEPRFPCMSHPMLHWKQGK